MYDFWAVLLPSWLTGVGTVGLALFAFLDSRASRKENRELRTEAKAERMRADGLAAEALQREDRAKERSQAEQVAAWSDRVRVDDPSFLADSEDPHGFAMRGTTRPAACVLNDSAAPITNVVVRWCDPRNLTSTLSYKDISVVPPRSHRAVSRPTSLSNGWPDLLPIELEFKDAHGRGWRRQADGQLERS